MNQCNLLLGITGTKNDLRSGARAAGLVVGVVGIVLAVIFYRRTVRTKLLAIGVTSPSPLVFTTQDIVVDYMGHSIKALSRSYILFWNRGTAAIEHSDFLEPIKFSADAPMLTMEILDRDVASQVSLDRDTSTISIKLLRPGEAVAFLADITDAENRPNLSVQMKSADMTALLRWPPGLLIAMCSLVLPVSYFAGPFVFLFYEIFNTDYIATIAEANPSASQTAISIAIAVVVIFAWLVIGGLLLKVAAWSTNSILRRIYSPVVNRFSELQASAWTGRQHWKDLRRKLASKTTLMK